MTTLLVAIALGCGSAQRPASPIDPAITEYLLTAAAGDLNAHAPAHPVRVRGVRLGVVASAGGAKQYLLCGQFASPREASWLDFATTRTSGYEQVIGELAATSCQRTTITWGANGDLSASLQARLDR